MQCPVDGTTLTLADRQGVEIDYCPSCRGVWLDRGELDKLVEREAAFTASPTRAPAMATRGRPSHHEDDDDDWVPLGGTKRKRKSFLSDIFEFGD